MFQNKQYVFVFNKNDESQLNLSTSIWFFDQIELVSGLFPTTIRSGMFELCWVVILATWNTVWIFEFFFDLNVSISSYTAFGSWGDSNVLIDFFEKSDIQNRYLMAAKAPVKTEMHWKLMEMDTVVFVIVNTVFWRYSFQAFHPPLTPGRFQTISATKLKIWEIMHCYCWKTK